MNTNQSNSDIKLSQSIQPLEGVGYNLQEPTTNTTAAPKIFFGNKIDARLHKALKVYSVNNNLEISYVLEEALSEFFVNHRSDFPTTNLTIAIEQQPRERKREKQEVDRCTVGNGECHSKAVGKAVYLPTNQEYSVCKHHEHMAQENLKAWKVL